MTKLIAALGLAAAAFVPDPLLAQGSENGRGHGQPASPPGQDVREFLQESEPGREQGEAISRAARSGNFEGLTYCPVGETFTDPNACQCPPSYTLIEQFGEDFQLSYYCGQE